MKPSKSQVMAPSASVDALRGRFIQSCRAYWQMTKPSIGMLVVITVIPTLLMAEGAVPQFSVAFAALVGTFLASASAGMFNHLVDSDIDSAMERTRKRPLPSGSVSSPMAFAIATLLGVVSFIMLWTMTTPLAAWISLAANAFYVLVYTMYLKRRTTQNIVIGGAAGSVGPLIGWAAVTGTIGWPAWALFALVFLWTPPHFWALAIRYSEDYKRANVPMLPSVKGDATTRFQIFVYTATLIPVVAWLWISGETGWIFGLAAGFFSLRFAWMAFNMYRRRTNELAMPIFYYSLLYIFGVFGFLTLDRVVAIF